MDFEGIGRVAANTTLAACAGRSRGRCSSSTPLTKKWDLGITINGFLGGPRGHHRPLLLGAARLGRSSSAPSPAVHHASRWSTRVECASGSTIPIGAVPVHWRLRHLGHALAIGLFATGELGVPDVHRCRHERRLIEGLFYGGGTRPALVIQVIGRRGRHAGRPRCWSWPGPDVRGSRPPARCGSRRRASSKASTSTSTAPPPTTRSSPTWAPATSPRVAWRSAVAASGRRRRSHRIRNGRTTAPHLTAQGSPSGPGVIRISSTSGARSKPSALR